MFSFKEMLADDVKNIFLNIGEFGEERMIDGRKTVVIVDDDLLQKRRSLSNNPSDGVYSAAVIFYVMASDLPKKPIVGTDMKLDSKLYKVSDVQEDESIYTVTLKSSRS